MRLQKHHINAPLEFDVTEGRAKLSELKKSGIYISFNGWLLKVIGAVLHKHQEAAANFYSKKRLIIFNEVNIR